MLLAACGPLPAAPGPRQPAPARLVVMVWTGTTATFGVIDLTGRFSARLTVDDPGGMGIRAALAPASMRVAMTVASPGRPAGQEARLLLADLDRGTVAQLYDAIDVRGRPLWSPEESEIVVRRSRVGPQESVDELLAVSVADGTARSLAADSRAIGRYAVGWNAAGIHLLRLASEGSWIGAEGEEGTHVSSGVARDFTLSPDGRWIAFSDYASGPTLGLLGPGGVVRLPLSGPFVHPAWGPDGTLRIASTRGGASEVVAVAPVPVVSIAAAPGTVALPAAVGRSGWVAARTVQLGPGNTVTDEWLELIGPDGQRRTVRLAGLVEPLGWREE